MLRKLNIIALGFILFSGNALSQTSAQSDSLAYSLGFSTYTWHTDKFAAGYDICTDNEGNIYISGNTRDKNFPATEGAYQTEIKGEADAFFAKFTPEGALVFASLIGGTKREHHTGLTVDDEGYIYMMGGRCLCNQDRPLRKRNYFFNVHRWRSGRNSNRRLSPN